MKDLSKTPVESICWKICIYQKTGVCKHVDIVGRNGKGIELECKIGNGIVHENETGGNEEQCQSYEPKS